MGAAVSRDVSQAPHVWVRAEGVSIRGHAAEVTSLDRWWQRA